MRCLFLWFFSNLTLLAKSPVVTTVGDMDDTNPLPKDVTQCHQLLLAAYRQARQLERQVTASQHEVVELGRVLDATADSFEKLQQEHAASLEELAWYKRWVYGKRRERVAEGEGQQHLFELTPADNEAAELGMGVVDMHDCRVARKEATSWLELVRWIDAQPKTTTVTVRELRQRPKAAARHDIEDPRATA